VRGIERLISRFLILDSAQLGTYGTFLAIKKLKPQNVLNGCRSQYISCYEGQPRQSKRERTRGGLTWQTIVNQIKVVSRGAANKVAASEVAVNRVAVKGAVSRLAVSRAIKTRSKAAAVKANAKLCSNGNVSWL
jgi:hypothetical protein